MLEGDTVGVEWQNHLGKALGVEAMLVGGRIVILV
jgi:hypothetical protein